MSTHPLDPLTAHEIRAVTGLLRGEGAVTDAFRFCSIELVEPPKEQMLAWTPGVAIPRTALAVLWDRSTHRTFEAVVDVLAGSVLSLTHIPGVIPNITLEEVAECEAALRRHPAIVSALAARGISDLDLILFDVWTHAGVFVAPEHAERRLAWVEAWRRASPSGNPYAHPVSHLRVVVDLSTMEVLDIIDPGPLGVAPVMGEYGPGLVPGLVEREDRKPLEIVQLEGPGFVLSGHSLSWHEWRMRIGFNHREGLVLHQVSFAGRSVAHRMSVAEMIVPYLDPSPTHARRAPFDMGEWGIGRLANSLEQGCDCLGEIRYLDAVVADARGEPVVIRDAICVHEDDNLVLWKHVDDRLGATTRRMRRLVVSFQATISNYDYLFYWRFHEDGSIECEVRATGIMITSPVPLDGLDVTHGTVVAAGTYAPFHQHFLIARLDLDVDGVGNTVLEVDSVTEPAGAANPFGVAVTTRATVIGSEAHAGRDHDWATQRSWKVVNPGRRNALGGHPGYLLVPSASVPLMLHPDSPQRRRAPVLGHQLWVTRHHDDERWPAGAYPVQSLDDAGMTAWIRDDEALQDADVVLWYVFGIHHIPRPEDWPVMPVDTVSFWLKPFGFFDRNPALDVAPQACVPQHQGHHAHMDHHHDHHRGSA